MRKIILFALLAAMLLGSASAEIIHTINHMPVEEGSEDDGIYIDGLYTRLMIWDIGTGQGLAVGPTTDKIYSITWDDMVEAQGSDEAVYAMLKIDDIWDMR